MFICNIFCNVWTVYAHFLSYSTFGRCILQEPVFFLFGSKQICHFNLFKKLSIFYCLTLRLSLLIRGGLPAWNFIFTDIGITTLAIARKIINVLNSPWFLKVKEFASRRMRYLYNSHAFRLTCRGEICLENLRRIIVSTSYKKYIDVGNLSHSF